MTGYEQRSNSERGRRKEKEQEERKEMGRKKSERGMWNAHVFRERVSSSKAFWMMWMMGEKSEKEEEVVGWFTKNT